MHERAARTTVTVRERVDRCKLDVRDRRLDERGDVIALYKVAEIRHQLFEVALVRRDEHRLSRGVATSADPYLSVT